MQISFGNSYQKQRSAGEKILASVNIENIQKEINKAPKKYPNYFKLKEMGDYYNKQRGTVHSEFFEIFTKATKELINDLEFRQMNIELNKLGKVNILFDNERKQWAELFEKAAKHTVETIKKYVVKP